MTRHLPPRPVRRAQGFTLVELLISMTIGLVLIAALGVIMTRYETSKRRNSTTSDLALNVGYIAYDLDRQLRSAGSGLSQNTGSLGCRINASLNGTVILPGPGAFPAPFAGVDTAVRALPVLVYPGQGNNGSDVIQVMTASAGLSEAPMEVLLGSVTANSLQLNNTLGIRGSDIMLLTDPAPRDCLVVQANPTYAGGAGNPQVNFAGPYFNGAAGPGITSFGTAGSALINMGNQTGNIPRLQLLGINGSRQLVAYDLLRLNNMPGAPTTPVPLADNVMDMRVRYGISGGQDGIVSAWIAPNTGAFTTLAMNAATGNASPAVNIVALRVALLLRGDRIEDSGPVSPTSFTMFQSLGAGAQVIVGLPAGEEKRNYKVVEFTVPLRNPIMASPFRTPPP
ncbi:PilW family protein [Mitsuaria sp. GD03876]|uniref:PilW family protein n=1 Tax=Mitsuaria sp. GD03876 TaxID=2975399 RepID=UPI0024477085|nr:PilW family protein [Mitsuaria sp. GD03876]MDH0864216.1 PilW family protein [Mitsuaria sp. GD03876]